MNAAKINWTKIAVNDLECAFNFFRPHLRVSVGWRPAFSGVSLKVKAKELFSRSQNRKSNLLYLIVFFINLQCFVGHDIIDMIT